jgi:predicted GNAT superfamily acetyltransferase
LGQSVNIRIRDVTFDDFPEILKLNQGAVPQVNTVDLDALRWFEHKAAYFRVAEAGDTLVGFLIAFAHDSGYPSKYFGWFCDRYDRFIYVDRVIVTESARRKRVAWRLFEDVERVAWGRGFPLVSDVYSRPPNQVSLSFHDKYGFQQVGSQQVDDGAREVVKFLKEPSPAS